MIENVNSPKLSITHAALVKMATVKSGSIPCLFVVVFLSFGLEILAANQLHFTHKPKYVQITPDAEQIRASEVADVVSLALGFSTNKELGWSGLSSGNLFRRPKANVLCTVEGVEDIKLNLEGVIATFPIEKDVPFISTEAVSQNIESLFPLQNPLTVDLSSDGKLFTLHSKHPHLFRDVPATRNQIQPVLLGSQLSVLYTFNLGSLNFSKDADFTFLSELQIVQEILDVISENKHLTQDGVPDIFTFSFGGMNHLIRTYGSKSSQVRDGIDVLSSFLNRLMTTLKALYGDDIVAEVATLTPNDPILVRQRRQSEHGDTRTHEFESSADVDPSDFNVAKSTSEDFPSLFHIVLWISVFWILTIFVICFLMWYMDPGDTIIYRMTSQRIKTE
ncbi:renin receptor-like [Ptychodera flava]|uniref:renin receptor-like n=1 Tax=Ptychodera flava TaxID=63121 RepID=UPI003969E879